MYIHTYNVHTCIHIYIQVGDGNAGETDMGDNEESINDNTQVSILILYVNMYIHVCI